MQIDPAAEQKAFDEWISTTGATTERAAMRAAYHKGAEQAIAALARLFTAANLELDR